MSNALVIGTNEGIVALVHFTEGLEMRPAKRLFTYAALGATAIVPLGTSIAPVNHSWGNSGVPNRFETRSLVSASAPVPVTFFGQHLAHPSDMVLCGGSLWVTDPVANSVVVLDPSSGRTNRHLSGATIGINKPRRIACTGGTVWVAGRGPNVTQLAASTGLQLLRVVVPTVAISDWIGDLHASGSTVWVDNSNSNKIFRIDATSGAVSAVQDAQSKVSTPSIMTSDGTSLFVAGDMGNSLRSSLATVSMSTSTVTSVLQNPHIGFGTLSSDPLAGPSAISTSGSGVWVANFSGNSISAFANSDQSLLMNIAGSSRSFDEPSALVASSNAIWVASATNNRIVSLDPRTGAVLQTITLQNTSPLLITCLLQSSNQLFAMSNATGAIFAINLSSGLPSRIGPHEAASDPVALATDPSGTWIVNGNVDKVVEVGSASGTILHTLDLSSRATSPLTSIADDGQHLWVLAAGSGQLFELSMTAKLIRVLSGTQLHNPSGVYSDGTRVWVTNTSSNSVTVFSATRGSVLWNVSGPTCAFSLPTAVLGDGHHIWIANSGGSSITELDSGTGRCLRILMGGKWKFDHPSALATSGGNLWVASSGGSYLGANQIYSQPALVDLSTTTLAVKWQVTPSVTGFLHPTALAFVKNHLWLAGIGDPAVREFSAQSGKFMTTTRGLSSPYSLATDNQRIWIGDPGTSQVKVLGG